MKTTDNKPLNLVPESVAAVRERIERDFSSLEARQPRVLRLVLNEAEAIAWQTGFPALVFPALAAEKARNIAAWDERQQAVRQVEPARAFAE
jgi:hypothetical protein